jgi:hypothetical protein
MTVDLSYGMRPRGHSAPVKRSFEQKKDPFVGACLSWLDSAKPLFEEHRGRDYYSASKLVEGVSVEQIHGIAMDPELRSHPSYYAMGIVLSAVYNRSRRKKIVFDLDAPMCYLGYRLPVDKILVNTGSAGMCFGEESFGVVVNNGEAGMFFGKKAYGIIVNNGTTGESFGSQSNGTAINNGKIGDECLSGFEGLFINAGSAGVACGEGASGMLVNLGTVKQEFASYARGPVLLFAEPQSANPLGKVYRPRSGNWILDTARRIRGTLIPDDLELLINGVADCSKMKPEHLVRRYGKGTTISRKARRMLGGRA